MSNEIKDSDWSEVRSRVELVNYTKDPVSVVVAAIKTKKSRTPVNINKKLSQSDLTILDDALSYMDTRALEHIHFTFQVSGISLAARSQLFQSMKFVEEQSRRDVMASSLGFVIPESLKTKQSVLSMYLDAMEALYNTYDEMILCDVPKDDAQYVMPLALTTTMMVTCTGRELFDNVIPLCTCRKAHWEVRDVAIQIHQILLMLAPAIFKSTGPRCHFGRCKDIEECRNEVNKTSGRDY